jgi:hypothetical protein
MLDKWLTRATAAAGEEGMTGPPRAERRDEYLRVVVSVALA